jgi:hypothetical protein
MENGEWRMENYEVPEKYLIFWGIEGKWKIKN